MKHILVIWSIFLFSLLIISCGEKDEYSDDTSTDNTTIIDTTAPTIVEVTAVITPTTDTTPDYTFSSDEAGTITYGGSCSSSIATAISGSNTITFISLSEGTYSNCTIIVKDSAGNASNTLAITSFEVIPSYFAVGTSGTFLKSTDGTTWTRVNTTYADNGSSISNSFNGVTYGGSTFVTVGPGGAILTSSDGTTWTSRTSGISNNFYGVTYGNSTFVSVGNSGTILTSSDGSSWDNSTSGTSDRLSGVTYGNSKFVAIGNSGTIIVSSDGTSWDNVTITADNGSIINYTTNNLNGVTYGNSTFVTVGNSGTILTSSNGTSWTSWTSGITNALYGVYYKE